jgi:hypothetical protein
MTILFFVNVAGAGSTPLHYAACGGNLKCCQVRTILLSLFFLLWYFGDKDLRESAFYVFLHRFFLQEVQER